MKTDRKNLSVEGNYRERSIEGDSEAINTGKVTFYIVETNVADKGEIKEGEVIHT